MGLGITLSNGFIYLSVFQSGVNSNLVFVKVWQNDGKMEWGKRLISRNQVDGMGSILIAFYDLVVNPRNTSQIMGSAKINWNMNAGYIPTNIMLYDNGTEMSTLYDYQYKPIGY